MSEFDDLELLTVEEMHKVLLEGVVMGVLVVMCAKCYFLLELAEAQAHQCPRCGVLDFDTDLIFSLPEHLD